MTIGDAAIGAATAVVNMELSTVWVLAVVFGPALFILWIAKVLSP